MLFIWHLSRPNLTNTQCQSYPICPFTLTLVWTLSRIGPCWTFLQGQNGGALCRRRRRRRRRRSWKKNKVLEWLLIAREGAVISGCWRAERGARWWNPGLRKTRPCGQRRREEWDRSEELQRPLRAELREGSAGVWGGDGVESLRDRRWGSTTGTCEEGEWSGLKRGNGMRERGEERKKESERDRDKIDKEGVKGEAAK